jgi:hypothetical protein
MFRPFHVKYNAFANLGSQKKKWRKSQHAETSAE